MQSRGELSTGIMWLICGSMLLMWLTSRNMPEESSPQGKRNGMRRQNIRQRSITSHAARSIVSYPSDIGAVPLITQRNAKHAVSAANDVAVVAAVSANVTLSVRLRRRQ